MKVQELRLRNYKRFHNKTLNLRDPETGLAEDLIVLVGDNGSGKSSVLQALASMLGAATGQLASPADLDWPGFDLSLANTAWARPLHVETDVEFNEDEIAATQEYYSRTEMARDEGKVAPGTSPVVTLRYDPDASLVKAPTAAEFFQFHGRRYARMILRFAPEGRQIFEQVGGVFWYTEHRTANSLTPVAGLTENGGQVIHLDDMDLLRRRLADWFNFRERLKRQKDKLRPGQRNFITQVEEAYGKIFPGHRFEGPVPRTEPDELSEMSGGERAAFPLIFDFAYWRIHNSVILIDELELHLHPPLQQGLLKALRGLGKNNQFIVTTHSDAVTAIVPEESIRRLP
jgi:predicted ATPase